MPEVSVKCVTISRKADRWFISFKVEASKNSNVTGEPIGIDLGLLRFATLSNNLGIDSPRPFKVLQKRLAKLQYHNRNKVIGSSNWRLAQIKIARLHSHIANVRLDFIHKVTLLLAKSHSSIVIEDLNISGLMKNGKLSKAIADSGFYEFRRQLEYKTKMYGSNLVLVDRWFPSSKTCFNCKQVQRQLPLSIRTFKCECGWQCDRDLNASYNLVRVVNSEFTPVDKKMPSSLVEAGSFQYAPQMLVKYERRSNLMSLGNDFSHYSTDELLKKFKVATFQGQPPKELVLELAGRPGIAFIQATDSTQVTLQKAYAAIRKIEQSSNK